MNIIITLLTYFTPWLWLRISTVDILDLLLNFMNFHIRSCDTIEHSFSHLFADSVVFSCLKMIFERELTQILFHVSQGIIQFKIQYHCVSVSFCLLPITFVNIFCQILALWIVFYFASFSFDIIKYSPVLLFI